MAFPEVPARRAAIAIMQVMFPGVAPRPSWPYVGEVARSLLGVVLAVAIALEWGSTAAAIGAGGSAAIAGAIALQDSPHGRLPLVLVVTAGMGAAVLLGWETAPYRWVFVAVVALWCSAAGMLWAVSSNAGQVAAAASALLVTAPEQHSVLPGPLTAAALAVAGGLLQVVLVAVWPRQRWRTQRDALAKAYRSVADGARRLAADPQSPLDIDQLIALRESFALTDRQARRRPQAFRGLYALPERIALTLDALRGAAAAPGVQDSLLATADVLTAIADGKRDGPSAAQDALGRLNAAVKIVPESANIAAARLRTQLREAAELHFAEVPVPAGAAPELRRAGLPGTFNRVRAQIAGQLSTDSPILRHAARLAAATAVGVAVARATGLDHGYWIALTVLMVLRPETAHTYTRCVSRVIGNICGVGGATLITMFLHPSGLQSAALAVLFLAIAYAVSGIGYVPLSAALAGAIVLLLDIDGAVQSDALGERVLAVMVGGLLAVAGHVLIPDRSLIRLRQRAGELLKAEIDYAAVVIRAFVHHLDDPDVALSAAWSRALRARSAFEAASGTVRADAPEVRRWLTSYRAALNAVTSTCATLEAHVAGMPPSTLDRRFIVAVDDYVDALRGDAPCPGQAWKIDAVHLTEADQQLQREAAQLRQEHSAQRLLVAEVGAISRHLLAIADTKDIPAVTAPTGSPRRDRD